MAQYCINKKRIRKLNIPKQYDIKQIQLGIPVVGDEARRVGLNNVGDIVLPSWSLGTTCKKNVYGYSYADKTKPKERRTTFYCIWEIWTPVLIIYRYYLLPSLLLHYI